MEAASNGTMAWMASDGFLRTAKYSLSPCRVHQRKVRFALIGAGGPVSPADIESSVPLREPIAELPWNTYTY